MNSVKNTMQFLYNNGYPAIAKGDITDIEDGSIDFENNPYVNVGVGVNYYTVSKDVFKDKSHYQFATVENRRELLQKLVEFWS